MTDPIQTDVPNGQNLRMAYQTLCTSYNAIDGIRGQLLGFLPLASSGIFVLLKENPGVQRPIGLFGFFITLGLYIFEIYGARRCTHLIILGQDLEKQLGIEGQFKHRPQGLESLSKRGHPKKTGLALISEPMAAGIIYPAVGAAWLYLGLQSIENSSLASVLSPLVFLFGFHTSYTYNRWLQNADVSAKQNDFNPDLKPLVNPETTAH
jgi:hypothetical protein